MADIETAARLIRLNGGRLVGKTRLQKSAYFLESLGLGFDLYFEYHHYGPYSEDLAALVDYDRALGLLDTQFNRTADGTEYAIFTDTGRDLHVSDSAVDERRRQVLRILAQYSSIELELAATADFLAKNGYGDDAWNETSRRKASKISNDRVVRAKQLLAHLSRR